MKKQLTYIFESQDCKLNNHGQIKKILQYQFKLSRHEISRLKFRGEILLDGKKAFVNQTMQPGQRLELHFPEEKVRVSTVSHTKVEILYEEEDFVVVNKPSGVKVHPSGYSEEMNSLEDALIHHYQESGEHFIVRIIGRLDKEVSGIVVYAKNRLAAARLTRQRLQGELVKEYIAIVHGHLEHSSGHISLPILAKNEIKGLKRCCVCELGKPALTFYQVVDEGIVDGEKLSLLRIRIETGRMHQIRVHLSAIGHPLLGDALYGGATKLLQRTALHCAKVTLFSPFTNMRHMIEKELPLDLKMILKDMSVGDFS